MPDVVVALLTPFGPNGRADLGALRAHVHYLVEAGVDGLMPCGTTGEGPLLEPIEVEKLVSATVEVAAGRVQVLAHVGRADTPCTVDLALRAIGHGAAAVSAVVPYYYALSDEQIAAHFQALLDVAGDTPAYAYTIPARTGNDLSPALLGQLVSHGLRGVKDSSKSLERHLEYLELDCDVLIGTDSLVAQSFAAGAAGCVSALANVRPDLLVALREGDDNAQAEILALRSTLPMQGLKGALAELLPGYPSAYRAPLGR